MMKGLILWSFIFFTIWNFVVAQNSTIEKRQICSNNGCGSCDGKSCNICNNNACCSSQSCNQCVNQCSNNCNTVTCKNNCVSGCSNNCQSQSCSVQSCSQCVNQCSNQCSTNQCVDNCSSKCDCKEKPIDPLEPPIIMEPSQPTSVNVNNTNNNVVNLTTHINISNLVHNFNNISVPVFVNTTNINYINITDINESKQPYPYPYPYQPQIPSTPIHDNCCYIMHPKTCYTEENGNRRCYIRRHRECSSSCTSPVVTIQEDPEVTSSGCHYINSYPYAYCGNYVRRDCGQCYTCGGGYNPRECFNQNGCSDICRRSVPNCVPSQSGLQCY